MVFMSYAMLYAGACPIVTAMCLLHFCLDNYFELLSDLHGYTRPVSETRLTTQVWTKWLEMIVYFVIIWNTIIMYVASNHIKLSLKYLTENPEYKVFIIFAAEHFLIGMVFYLKKFITDLPDTLRE